MRDRTRDYTVVKLRKMHGWNEYIFIAEKSEHRWEINFKRACTSIPYTWVGGILYDNAGFPLELLKEMPQPMSIPKNG